MYRELLALFEAAAVDPVEHVASGCPWQFHCDPVHGFSSDKVLSCADASGLRFFEQMVITAGNLPLN